MEAAITSHFAVRHKRGLWSSLESRPPRTPGAWGGGKGRVCSGAPAWLPGAFASGGRAGQGSSCGGESTWALKNATSLHVSRDKTSRASGHTRAKRGGGLGGHAGFHGAVGGRPRGSWPPLSNEEEGPRGSWRPPLSNKGRRRPGFAPSVQASLGEQPPRFHPSLSAHSAPSQYPVCRMLAAHQELSLQSFWTPVKSRLPGPRVPDVTLWTVHTGGNV